MAKRCKVEELGSRPYSTQPPANNRARSARVQPRTCELLSGRPTRPSRPGPKHRRSVARASSIAFRFLEDRLDELTEVITVEYGKVLSDAKGEIQRGMEVVEFATGAPQLLK